MATERKKKARPATNPKPLEVEATGYAELLAALKERIATARIKAALAVNRELVSLYWSIGQAIVERQQTAGWGKSVVERLVADIQKEFPGIQGFSPRNIWRMRAFYLAYTKEVAKSGSDLAGVDGVNLPQAVAEIPWAHNVILIEKVKEPAVRMWYIRKTVEHGWSRNVLALQIGSRLHARQGKAVTNFERTLPALGSDLAQQLLKDPYHFDFLTLADDAHERELEQGLLGHIQKFLLELGVGFAFVGNQYHLEVGGESFYLDLLFYHCKLHCYFAIDLKMTEFEPEYAGQMNFYLSAVDDLVRDPSIDRPTLGLILCREKNRVVAEYALRDIAKPIGIAGFETRLVESLPKELKGSLPTIAELEEELEKATGGD